jgi:beta-xylosidase
MIAGMATRAWVSMLSSKLMVKAPRALCFQTATVVSPAPAFATETAPVSSINNAMGFSMVENLNSNTIFF